GHLAGVVPYGVPVAFHDVVGSMGCGWGGALTTIGHERAGLGAGAGVGFRVPAPGGSRFEDQRRTSVGELVAASPVSQARVGTGGAAMIGGGVAALVRLAKALGRDSHPLVRQPLAPPHPPGPLNPRNRPRGRAAAAAA